MTILRYLPGTDPASARFNYLITCCRELRKALDAALPTGREWSLARTKLDELEMWAKAAFEKEEKT